MAIKIGQYISYPNCAAWEAVQMQKMDEITLNSLRHEVRDQVNKSDATGRHIILTSLTKESFAPEKLQSWLKCWEQYLIEARIADLNQLREENLRFTGLTLCDLTQQARENDGCYFLKLALVDVSKIIARFKTGMMNTKAMQPSERPIPVKLPVITPEDFIPETRAKITTVNNNEQRRVNIQTKLRNRLDNKNKLKQYNDRIKNVYDQIKWMAELTSLGKELDTLSEQEIADRWDAFTQKKLQQEDRGIDPELLKELELEAEAPEQKGPPAKALGKKHRAKLRSNTNAVATTVTTGVQPSSDREKAQKVSAVTASAINPLHLQVMNLNAKVRDGQCLYSLHDRCLRWRGAKPSAISTFTDFDSESGHWVLSYAACTTKAQLTYQKRVHAIPMERIMNQPALVDKYSFGYRFCGSDGTKNQTGRCFYAEMTDKSGHVEKGLIRVASGDDGQIYHIHFQKSGTLSLEQLTQSVPCPPKEVSEGKEGSPQAEEGGFESVVGPYNFALGFNDTIVMTIHEDGTTFTLWPVK
jgi:hypothetical protein